VFTVRYKYKYFKVLLKLLKLKFVLKSDMEDKELEQPMTARDDMV
jgi:hypothetical protein